MSESLFTPINQDDNELEHYGVKGMKWGVRKSNRPDGVSGKTYRTAKKDAKEYARAKMFYGEGAGTRRKLIKSTVEARSAKDPSYKKAFDAALADQDMSKHAAKARAERSRKDTTKSAAKTVRGIKNLALGTGASVTVSSALIYYAAQDPRVIQAVSETMKKTVSTANQYRSNKAVMDYLKNNGFI